MNNKTIKIKGFSQLFALAVLAFFAVGAVVGLNLLQNPKGLGFAGAWDCSNYLFNVSGDGQVTVLNKSSRSEPAQTVIVTVSGVGANGPVSTAFAVPALSAYGVTPTVLGTVSVPSSGSFNWTADASTDCSQSGTQTASACNSAFDFNIGDNSGVGTNGNLTPISTTEPTLGANKLVNGSFDTTGSAWLNPWYTQISGGAAAAITQDSANHKDGSYSALVNVTTASATDWYVQLKQKGFSLTAGTANRLTYWIKSAVPTTVSVAIQQGVSPYTVYFRQVVNVTTSWQQFTLNFTPVTSDTNVLLAFNLAKTKTQISIDGVELH